MIAGVLGVARERNRLGLLLRTGTWWASFEANPPSARLVFKSSLVLSGKAAKDNFTTEPRSPSRLLGGIELICHRRWISDEVLLQASGQTIARFCGGTAIPTDSSSLCLIAGLGGFGWGRNRVGPFVRLERSGRRFEPIRKARGLSQNRALF
ncbi:hypothetical protein ACFQHW_00935 [Lapidilactobacillus achengensis]|uniref:Uncharacterized protein n=1 Tax=Lapidilactobacillus achengensis TaxID=2486000 RepID=A0ABW1UJP0_9LACO|nr:hypothetical protein [Lapidilactobacillus achengensis]